MLALPAPYGHESFSGVWIGLVPFRSEYDWSKIRETLLNFSCYPPAISKIFDLLKQSQSYTCILQLGWVKDQYNEVYQELYRQGVLIEYLKIIKMDVVYPTFKDMRNKQYGRDYRTW